MAKYKKKPVEIEAFQYDGDLKGTDGKWYVPEWAVKAFEDCTHVNHIYSRKPMTTRRIG